MPLYHIAFLLLLAGTIVEFRKKETPKKLYYVVFCLLAVMLCFRYGQGSDYFGYGYSYNVIAQEGISALMNANIHGEVGWKLLCYLFTVVNVPYTGFVFLHAAVEMVMLWLFVERFCKHRCLALLLSYHTLYLTYFFSALRQGLVMAIFLGLLLDWLLKKKYVPYFIASAVCALIHSCGFLFFVVPILHHTLLKPLKNQIILVVLVWGAGLVLASGALDGVLPLVLPQSVLNYYYDRSLSVNSLERVVTYAIVVFVYWLHDKKKLEKPKYMEFLMQVVTLGMIVYGGFVWLPMVASRLAVAFKLVEIALLSSLLLSEDIWRKLVILFCVALATFMYVKNIISYVDQGQYFDHVNFLNYPYVSLFDPTEILDYREPPYGELP